MAENKAHRENIYLIIVIGVDILLFTLLVLLLWWQVLAPKASPATEQSSSTSTSASNEIDSTIESDSDDGHITYTNNSFSFQYPATGWTVKEVTVNDMPPATTLTSSDYAQTGMGVDAGAIISVNVTEKVTTADQEFAELNEQRTTFGIEELQKTTYRGQTAITYYSAYEGMRYHTLYFNEGKIYDVTYSYADDASAEDYMNVYDMVTQSFTFV